MFPSPDEETELDVEDVIKAATKVLDAVSDEKRREVAFAGAALAAIMLHRGPSSIAEPDIELVEELSVWLASRPPTDGLIH